MCMGGFRFFNIPFFSWATLIRHDALRGPFAFRIPRITLWRLLRKALDLPFYNSLGRGVP